MPGRSAITYDEALASVERHIQRPLPRAADVAGYFGVHPRTIARWAANEGLGYVQPGGPKSRYYPHEAIARFIVARASRVPSLALPDLGGSISDSS